MASTRSTLEGLILSSFEIRELTGWPDAMVEDYLNILRNIIKVADLIDSVEDADQAQFDALKQLMAEANGRTGKHHSMITSGIRRSKKLEQLIYAW